MKNIKISVEQLSLPSKSSQASYSNCCLSCIGGFKLTCRLLHPISPEQGIMKVNLQSFDLRHWCLPHQHFCWCWDSKSHNLQLKPCLTNFVCSLSRLANESVLQTVCKMRSKTKTLPATTESLFSDVSGTAQA